MYTAGMKTISLCMRERILACYDHGVETREGIARRFCVSLGLVKKLIQQRKRIGDIGPLHARAGRKPMITQQHKKRMLELIAENNDTTLAEFRAALRLSCSLTAIHNALAGMDQTYKKRHFGRTRKTVRT